MPVLRCSFVALRVIVALAAAPLFLGWINQWRAWLQNKSAPSLWLPYRGIRKLFHKEAVIAEGSKRFTLELAVRAALAFAYACASRRMSRSLSTSLV